MRHWNLGPPFPELNIRVVKIPGSLFESFFGDHYCYRISFLLRLGEHYLRCRLLALQLLDFLLVEPLHMLAHHHVPALMAGRSEYLTIAGGHIDLSWSRNCLGG